MSGRLQDRVVLLTGATGGLGQAVARAVSAEGAEVVLLGRKVPKLNRLNDALAAADGRPAIYPLDLEGATPEDYDALAVRIEEVFGRLDGIVHAAADMPGLTPLEHTRPLDFARAIHVNLTAPALLTRACLPLLKRAPDAAVVFIGEDPTRVGRAHWGGYAVAKHGLAGLVAVWGDELLNTPVRVCGLQPGPMRTPLRGRACFGENPAHWPEPVAYAPAVVELLSADGAPWRGRMRELHIDGVQ